MKLGEEAANSASGLVMARGKKSELAYEGGRAKGKKRKSESSGMIMNRRQAKGKKRKSESAGMSGMEAKGKSDSVGMMSRKQAKGKNGKNESAGISRRQAKGKNETSGSAAIMSRRQAKGKNEKSGSAAIMSRRRAKGKNEKSGSAAIMSRRQAKGKIEGGRDWTALPEGIVDYIGDLLLAEHVTEYIHLRGVCASWRRVTLEPGWCWRFRPRNWILISDRDDLPHCTFLNLSTGKRIRAHVPELSRRHTTFLRVADGLLFFMDDDSPLLHLLNPFTGAFTPLPPLHPVLNHKSLCLVFEPKDVCRGVRDRLFNVNLALSSSSSILVVLTFSRTISYAKVGDTEWSFTTFPFSPFIQCFQGRLYSLCTLKGELLRFEPHQNRFTTLCPSLSDPTLWPDPQNEHWFREYFLVATEEELLVACCYDTKLYCYCFKVFKLDLENGTLIPKKSIGERAIFIRDMRKAFTVSASTFAGVVPNSIYLTRGFRTPTYIFHPIGCACHPKSKKYLKVVGPSCWVDVFPEPMRSLADDLNLYCIAY